MRAALGTGMKSLSAPEKSRAFRDPPAALPRRVRRGSKWFCGPAPRGGRAPGTSPSVNHATAAVAQVATGTHQRVAGRSTVSPAWPRNAAVSLDSTRAGASNRLPIPQPTSAGPTPKSAGDSAARRTRRTSAHARNARPPPGAKVPAWYSKTPGNSYQTPYRFQRNRTGAMMPSLAQFLKQQGARPMQPGPHRADGAAEHDGGLPVIHFLQIAQDHHFAVPPGQSQHRAAQGPRCPLCR